MFARSVLSCLIVFVGLVLALPLHAQDSKTLGYGRLFSNDLLGDGHDRWRSGSYSLSILRGRDWQGALPAEPGAIVEYRLRNEIISPYRGGLTGPADRPDRPYVGLLSLGLHTHYTLGQTEVSVGLDLVATGPQTGVSAAQEAFHDRFGLQVPRGTDSQIGDGLNPAVTLAFARRLRLSDQVTLRPFVEAQGGIEDLLRVGGDVVIGRIGHDDLWLRDVPTGQLYRGIAAPDRGLALVAGADLAQVAGSLYLPRAQGYEPERRRARARAGVHWQPGPGTAFFYGISWLSPEFAGQDDGQDDGQIVGSLTLNFNF